MAEYIEREKAKEKLCSMCRWEGTSNCEECEHPIYDIPAADVAPVRHGRWIESGSFKYKRGGRNSEMKVLFGTEWRQMLRLNCSECHMITLVDDSIAYEYCPHCGAKMGEEE